MPSPILPSEPQDEPGAPALTELPELQLVPVPDGWPPYDCEVHGVGCPAAQDRVETGRLAGVEGAEADAGSRVAPPARAVVSSMRADGSTGAARTAQARDAASAGLPATAGETAAWPRQFGQVILEVLAGHRAPRQLTAWTTDHARAQVGALLRVLASVQRPRIQRIITSWPTEQVVEMTMVVRFGPRSRALALRFEQAPARKAAPGLPARPARWLCTDIEAG